MSCYVMLWYTMSYHVMLFCVILCYVVMLCSWTWHHWMANRWKGFYFESNIIFYWISSLSSLYLFRSFSLFSPPFCYCHSIPPSPFSSFLLSTIFLLSSPLLIFFLHFFSSSCYSSSFFNNFYHHRFGDAYCENPQRIRVVEEVRAGIKAIIADFDLVDTEGIATSLLP